nr:hypothetical protein [Tanacetum cinerariifolium]
MLRLQIEQYFQIEDDALWDVIKNGNSFKPVAETTKDDACTSTIIIPGPVTITEKAKKKNDVKARSMLLIALPNEHLMSFNQYKDAKTLFTEDLNLKFLRSLSSEWNTHVVVWRNKLDLDTMSIVDLCNNFKIVEQEVRGTTNLEQFHEDDLEEMDLKWQLALLSMRAKRFFYKTGKKITINGSDTVGYDKSKVERFNCNKIGHFARECRVLRNQKNRIRNQEITRKTVNVEDSSSKAMVEFDGASFDWSYMVDDEAPKNMAFMALSGSECHLAGYKRGLASVEEQLVHYQMNKSILNENIAILKRDIKIKDSKIVVLKSKLEKISNENDALETKYEKFENASQSLDKLIGSQVIDISKKGLGYVSYNAVPPTHTRRFSPLRIDLSHTVLPEFVEPSVQGYRVKPIKVVTQKSSVKISAHVKENNGALLNEDWESDEEDEVESPLEKERKNVEPSVDKVEVKTPKQNDKPARRPFKYAEM